MVEKIQWITSVNGLNKTKVCTNTGTTTELNMRDFLNLKVLIMSQLFLKKLTKLLQRMTQVDVIHILLTSQVLQHKELK